MMDDDFGFGVPQEDLRRLKPYLAACEARMAAMEEAMKELAHKVMGDNSPDPQQVAAEAFAKDASSRS